MDLVIPPKYIPRIHLLFHIIQAAVVSVCYNRCALLFECFQVVDDAAAKKCTAIFQRRLIDNDRSAFGFDPFHDALDATLAKEILSGPVALHDCLNEVFRHILIIGQKLFSVFRQAIAAIAEGRVVVVGTDTRVQADSFDDLLRVQTFHLRIGVQLVEIADPEGKICIGKELDRLRFGKSHDEGVDIFFNGPLLQQTGKCIGCLHQSGVLHVGTDDDAGRIQIIVQSFRLPEKLRAENNVVAMVFFPDRGGKSDRNGGFDDHDGVGIILNDQLDDCFHSGSIEKILFAVVIGRCGDNYNFSIKGHVLQLLNFYPTYFEHSFFLFDIARMNNKTYL